MSRIDELLQQREMIDAELQLLRGEAVSELEAAKAKVEQLEAKLGTVFKLAHQPSGEVRMQHRETQPIDETDAGNGIGEQRDSDGSAQSFNDELAELRARSQARRRR